MCGMDVVVASSIPSSVLSEVKLSILWHTCPHISLCIKYHWSISRLMLTDTLRYHACVDSSRGIEQSNVVDWHDVFSSGIGQKGEKYITK